MSAASEEMAPSPHRVAGEDAPKWVAYAFAGSGLLMALAASYLAATLTLLEPDLASRPVTEPSHPLAPPISEPAAPAEENKPQSKSQGGEARAAAECLPIVSIAFPYGSSRPMTQGAKERLAPILQWLRDHPEGRLLVEGHTDSKGSESFNVMLSYSRAQAVIAWLTKSGAPKSQMVPLAAGTAQPDDPSLVTAENRMALLRVEGVAPCRNQNEKSR